MPNGGLTPDCVHCKHFTGQPISDEKAYCQHHKINLPSPIRAFCKAYVDPEPAVGRDWLDTMLDRKTLKNDWMYLWLGGYEVPFYYAELVPAQEYATWTQDVFLEQIQILSDKYSNK